MEPLTTAQQELFDWLVAYIRETHHAPSIRQMMKGMNLKSPAPVQSRLDKLRAKGYVDWIDGQARTLRILHMEPSGIPVLGAIAAGGLVEPYTEEQERLDLEALFTQPDAYALRVMGDSMIEDFIAEGDLAILRSVSPGERIKTGEIVAARVPGQGTTLKRYYRQGKIVTLRPSNPRYLPIEVSADSVEIQGVLLGVWRGSF
ncbi:MAG: transcriptional repressor LexA [Cyanobacteria bacterium P01_H01_bin.15]